MKQTIRHMDKGQVNSHVFDRCLKAWECYSDYCDASLEANQDILDVFIRYFRCVNNQLVKPKNEMLWLKIHVLLDDCEVAMENHAWDDLATHITCITRLFQRANLYKGVVEDGTGR